MIIRWNVWNAHKYHKEWAYEKVEKQGRLPSSKYWSMFSARDRLRSRWPQERAPVDDQSLDPFHGRFLPIIRFLITRPIIYVCIKRRSSQHDGMSRPLVLAAQPVSTQTMAAPLCPRRHGHGEILINSPTYHTAYFIFTNRIGYRCSLMSQWSQIQHV